jgi:hypothetical protein
MKLPRLTVRWLMIAVLLSALPAWWFVGRPAWFNRVADRHHAQFLAETTFRDVQEGSKPVRYASVTMLGEWHRIMRKHYHRAAENPWMPIGPDPRKPRPGDVLIEAVEEDEEPRFGTSEEARKIMLERQRRRR